MKTIRYPLKTSTKIQLKIARKSSRGRKAYFAPQKMLECAVFDKPKNVLCDISLLRPGKK